MRSSGKAGSRNGRIRKIKYKENDRNAFSGRRDEESLLSKKAFLRYTGRRTGSA